MILLKLKSTDITPPFKSPVAFHLPKASGYSDLQGSTQYPPTPLTLWSPLPLPSTSPYQLYTPSWWTCRECSLLRNLYTMHCWPWFCFGILHRLLFKFCLLNNAFPDKLWKISTRLNSVHTFPTLFIWTISPNFKIFYTFNMFCVFHTELPSY